MYYSYKPKEADLELVKKAETKVLTEKAKVIGISTQPNFYKQIPNYLMDEIAIKTIARSNPFVLILEKGKVVEKLGAKDYLDKMIAADKLIGNDDRHFGNFGFIRNVQTCQITGFAPLFDSGSSFYGLNEERKTAKLFEAESFMAIKEVMKKHDLNAALNHSQMFDLIEKYPEISWSKKQEMKNRILQTSAELKKMTLKINKELQKEKSLRFLAELEELDSTVVVNNN